MKKTLLPSKKHTSPEAVLLAAVTALETLRKNQCTLDEYLDREIDDAVLRRRLSNLLFTLYRRKRFIDRAIKNNCSKTPDHELYALLSAAAAMAVYQDSLAAESVVNIAVSAAKKSHSVAVSRFVNAILRKMIGQLNPAEAADALPENLQRRWQKEFGSETAGTLNELFLKEAFSSVRLRNGQVSLPDDVMQELPLDLPWKFYKVENLSGLLASDMFKQGAFYIQDPAPAKVCALLQKHLELLPEKVHFIDLCAAPGGKLIMNMELLQTSGRKLEAIALDRSPRRLELVKKNLQRCSLTAGVIAGDASDTPQLAGKNFELVTCDVPCSNSGVFRRRPDAIWRWKKADLPAVCKLQADILGNAGKLTAPGGLLLYSTCSLEKEENQTQIQKFLEHNKDFSLLDMQLFMPDEYCDGTFAALLQKIN